MSPDGNVREITERPGVGRDHGAVRCLRSGGDDEIVSSSPDAFSADGNKQSGVGRGDVDVVAQDRNSGDDVVHERLAPGTVPALGQLNADAQFGHGDRRDGHFVVVGDQLIEVITGPFRIDQEGRVEEQPVQDRSSTSTSWRSATSSSAQLASVPWRRRTSFNAPPVPP